jgi:hypothetical protein
MILQVYVSQGVEAKHATIRNVLIEICYNEVFYKRKPITTKAVYEKPGYQFINLIQKNFRAP